MLKSLFNKVAGLIVCNFFEKKNSGAGVSCKFSKIFKRTNFVEHARTDAWVKWIEKIVFTKFIHRETPVMTSFLMQLQTYGLTVFLKRDSITDAFLWKLVHFTEHQFYRIMLRHFWFPVTFSMYACLTSGKSVQS